MRDFLPLGYRPKITLDRARFHFLFKRKICELAIFRCREVVRRYKKRIDDRGDRDYQP